MISINLDAQYIEAADILKSMLHEQRVEELKKKLPSSLRYSNSVSLNSANTDMDSVKSIIRLGLCKDLLSKENLWIEETFASSVYTCDIYKYAEGDIIIAQYSNDDKGGNTVLNMLAASNSKELLEKIAEIKSALKILVDIGGNLNLDINIYWKNDMVRRSKSSIVCPSWKSISDNYVEETRENVQEIIRHISRDQHTGRLILWYGQPGTGKTWAIRSLIRELDGKYVPVVITDSDAFLRSTSYYYDVTHDFKTPCLFIIEDSVESILSETRRTYEGKVSKLLNLTDGLMAQGRRDLFLISFNEDIKSIDPAFTRHGRCLGMIEFLPFGKKDAQKWLKNKNGQHDLLKEETTLAELYGIINQDILKERNDERKIGFVI